MMMSAQSIVKDAECHVTSSQKWLIFFAMSGFGGEFTVLGGVMPVAICWMAGAFAMVAGSLVTRPPSEETVAKFFP
mgnify:CR=1 FL=1